MFRSMSRIVTALFALLAVIASAVAFAPIVPQAIEINVASVQQQHQQQQVVSSIMERGVQNYLVTSNAGTSTLSLSLKDRPPPPTAEEIAAKQRNFNFWFWGGGFVAPFLATFYYFGFKFWEK